MAAGIQGTVELEITIGPDGLVADASVIRSIPQLDQAAIDSVFKWQYFPPTLPDGGGPVSLIHTVQIPFVLPSAEPAPREIAPPTAPPPTTAKPTPLEPSTPKGTSPPAGEPRPQPSAPSPAAEEASIRQTLRAYEGAWRALDADALRQVQQLSGPESDSVRKTMASAQSYEVGVAVENVQVTGTRAQVRAQVTRRFQPRSGRASNTTTGNTFELEKQGDRWIITRIR
jgi:TonB family protein